MEKENGKNTQSLVKLSESIASSFMKMKFLSIACIVGMVATALGAVAFISYDHSQNSGKVYVIDKGQAFSATRQDAAVTREEEVKAQAVRFHELFFNVTPNQEMMNHNIERVLKFSDRSVYNYYADLQERGHYKRILQTNATQDIIVDSVRTDIRQYPYPVVTYATLFITRESVITKYSLVTTCTMRETSRSLSNMNGLLVENFSVPQNEEVGRRKR